MFKWMRLISYLITFSCFFYAYWNKQYDLAILALFFYVQQYVDMQLEGRKR